MLFNSFPISRLSTAFELPEPDVAEADAQEIGAVDLNNRDELFEAAARLVVSTQQGSASNIQRRFSVGYNRAGRIVDQLEAAGIIGPYEGSKPRQVLVKLNTWNVFDKFETLARFVSL